MAQGKVPGVYFPESLAHTMGNESKQQRLDRAARMLAIFRGQGYSGAHFGGNGLDFDDISQVLDLAEEYKNCWKEH